MQHDHADAGTSWTIAGSDDQPILGNAHVPEEPAKGVLIFAHGFKGYKDYGMFPSLARAAQAAGFLAHRFNFSHSGMTERIETFERPELFERDTWNRQVYDLRTVIRAVRSGDIPGGDLPIVLVGHSRGGVTSLLAAGRRDGDMPDERTPSGIITLASPAECCTLDEQTARQLLDGGRLGITSSRTGQELYVGSGWLSEQVDDPDAHDVPLCVARISCPIVFVHGDKDEAVPFGSMQTLDDAARDSVARTIAGANHVFNTPNPMPADAAPSPALAEVIALIIEASTTWCAAPR